MRQAKVRESLTLLRDANIGITHIIDVGIQHYTQPLMEIFPDKFHYLFEPVEEYYPHIRRNYAHLQTQLIEAACSDFDGEMHLNTSRVSRGDEISHANLSVSPTATSRLVRVLRLDTFFANAEPSERYLLKVDVEGTDVPQDILRGSARIYDRILAVQIEMTVDRFMERAVILHQAGFELWDLCDLCYYGDCLWQCDAFFIRRDIKQAYPSLRPMSVTPFSIHKWQSGF